MESQETGKKEESAEEETSKSPQKNKEQGMSLTASEQHQDQVMNRMNDKDNNVVKQPSPSFLALQKNPLLINLILEKTLSHLPLTDLFSCRLVCQDWNRVSTPNVKSKSEIILSPVDLTLQDPSRGTNGNNHFLKTMKNALSIPSTKFQLRFHPSNPDLSQFQGLIDLCPNEITSLHLTSSNVGHHTGWPVNNKTTFKNWMKALKNLTVLTITDYYFGVMSSFPSFEPGFELNLVKLLEFHCLDVGAGGNLSSGFYDCFFKAAQNLEKVSFGVKDYRDQEKYENVHPLHPMDVWQHLYRMENLGRMDLNVVLNSLLNYGRLDGIKSLTFHNLNNMNLATLVAIGNKGLQLDTFQVKGRILFDSISFNEFLETQKKSLKTLEVSVENDPLRTLALEFPTEMKELKRLTLSNNGPLEIELEEPICYSSRFPKIRTLHVQSGNRMMRRCHQDVGMILGSYFPELDNLMGCETMKELRMDFILADHKPSIKEAKMIQQRVSRIFPTMTIRVQVHRVENDEDDQILDENARARGMTLKIYGD